MIHTKYEVNMSNSNPSKIYFLSPLYFQNCHLKGKMRITHEDEFSDFSDTHSDILEVFPYNNKKKITDVFAETFFCF